ncbi:MAG: hypothetical protein DMG40_17765 [Acidobacteria bacterium]|nr:MAG: hypothetical protein DMG40_17765 [Acidobacteriota bacterium]
MRLPRRTVSIPLLALLFCVSCYAQSSFTVGTASAALGGGTDVSAGMKLGTITDYFGKVIAEPRAPVTGVVLHVKAVPSLKKGDNIADLGVVAAHAP